MLVWIVNPDSRLLWVLDFSHRTKDFPQRKCQIFKLVFHRCFNNFCKVFTLNFIHHLFSHKLKYFYCRKMGIRAENYWWMSVFQSCKIYNMNWKKDTWTQLFRRKGLCMIILNKYGNFLENNFVDPPPPLNFVHASHTEFTWIKLSFGRSARPPTLSLS